MTDGFKPEYIGRIQLEQRQRLAQKYPFLAKYFPLPTEPELEPKWWHTLLQEVAPAGAAVEELGKRAGMLIAAPFVPEVRERVTKEDVLPTPEPPEGRPPSRAMEAYEEEVPGVAKFFAEEAIYLPLYLAGGFGAKKAAEELAKGAYKRFAVIAPKIEAGQRLGGKDRLLYEVIQRFSKGRIETITPQIETEILRELYGTARLTTTFAPGEVAQLAGRVGVKETLTHIPQIVQKELGALGWTIDDMTKMTKSDALALRTVAKTNPDEVRGIKELLAKTPTEILTKPTARSTPYEIETYKELTTVAKGGMYIPEEGAIVVADKLSNKIGLHELGHAVWHRFFPANQRAVFNDEFAASSLSKTLRARDFPEAEFFSDIFRKTVVGQPHTEFPKTTQLIKQFIRDIGKKGMPEDIYKVTPTANVFRAGTPTHTTIQLTQGIGKESGLYELFQGGKVVGSLKVSVPEKSILRINTLTVPEPSTLTRTMMKDILEAIQKDASKRGFKILEVQPRRKQIAMYRAAGFELPNPDSPKAKAFKSMIAKMDDIEDTLVEYGDPTGKLMKRLEELEDAIAPYMFRTFEKPLKAPTAEMRAGKNPQIQKVLDILDQYEGARWAKPAPSVVGSKQGLLRLPKEARAELYKALEPIVGSEKARVLRDWRPTKIRTWLETGEAKVAKPPIPPKPPVPPNAIPTPPPAEDPIVKRMVEFIKALKPARRQLEKLQEQARVGKAARLARAMEAKVGEEAHIAAQKARAGRVALEAPVPEVKFTPDDVSHLKELARTSTELPPISADKGWARARVMDALDDLILQGKIPQPAEMELFEKVFGKEIAKALISTRPLGRRVWDATVDALNLPKAIRASWDISMVLRQGIFGMLDKPWRIPGTVKNQFKFFFNDKQAKLAHDAAHATKWEGIMNETNLYRPDFWSTTASITAREEAYMSRIAKAHVPLVARSERAYVVGLNKLRTDMFVYEAEQWARMGVKAEMRDYKELARTINILTGRGGGVRAGDAMAALNTVFFSPRFQMSRLMTPSLLFSKSPLVRKMAGRVIAKYMMFNATLFGGIKMLADPNISTEFNPLSTEFGKIRVGNTHYDVMAGFAPWMRFFSRLITNKTKSITGATRDTDMGRLVWTFARTKLSPWMTATIDWRTGSTMIGEKLEDMSPYKQIVEHWSPLAIQAIIEGLEEEGLVGMGKALPEFIGVGVMTYDSSMQLVGEVRHRRSEYLETSKKWEELQATGSPDEIEKFYRDHPELQHGDFLAVVQRDLNRLENIRAEIKDDPTITQDRKEQMIEDINSQMVRIAVDALATVEGLPIEYRLRGGQAPQTRPKTRVKID